jgi:hypothetical protein
MSARETVYGHDSDYDSVHDDDQVQVQVQVSDRARRIARDPPAC